MTVTRQRVNQRMRNIAILTDSDAALVQAAIDHLHDQEIEVHLWPAATIAEGPSGGTTILIEDEDGTTERVPTTSVDREIIRVQTIRERRRNLSEMLDAFDGNRKDIRDYCHEILRINADPEPADETPHCDGRHLAGFDLERDDGGWANPFCTRIPRRGDTGPCDACYMRHVRWRARNGYTPLHDTEPAR